MRQHRLDLPGRRQGRGKLFPREQRQGRTGDVKTNARLQVQPKVVDDTVLPGVDDEPHAERS